jgi:hypothetical protein
MVKKTASEPTEETTYKPMAAPAVTDKDRIEALLVRVETLEKQIGRHERYHFGKQG